MCLRLSSSRPGSTGRDSSDSPAACLDSGQEDGQVNNGVGREAAAVICKNWVMRDVRLNPKWDVPDGKSGILGRFAVAWCGVEGFKVFGSSGAARAPLDVHEVVGYDAKRADPWIFMLHMHTRRRTVTVVSDCPDGGPWPGPINGITVMEGCHRCFQDRCPTRRSKVYERVSSLSSPIYHHPHTNISDHSSTASVLPKTDHPPATWSPPAVASSVQPNPPYTPSSSVAPPSSWASTPTSCPSLRSTTYM